MNIDFKMFNKILAKGVQQCTKRMIDYDQVEFFPNMQYWIKIQKSYHTDRLRKKKNPTKTQQLSPSVLFSRDKMVWTILIYPFQGKG